MSPALRWKPIGIVRYSGKIKGDRGNYKWPISLDLTNGYLGINQYNENGDLQDRVILSRKQVAAIRTLTEDKP